jgi:hypothetical protein
MSAAASASMVLTSRPAAVERFQSSRGTCASRVPTLDASSGIEPISSLAWRQSDLPEPPNRAPPDWKPAAAARNATERRRRKNKGLDTINTTNSTQYPRASVGLQDCRWFNTAESTAGECKKKPAGPRRREPAVSPKEPSDARRSAPAGWTAFGLCVRMSHA